ncbi:MAG: exosortase A [Halieaceae bacterium]|jgi:exosortase A|nr:exosortase A [Halieaceae bacterium]
MAEAIMPSGQAKSRVDGAEATRRENTAAPALLPWIVAGGLAVLITVLFRGTAGSMVAIWMRSDTFAHGFLILPIAAWLAWRDRPALAALTPRPVPWVIALMLGPGAAWLLATLVDVLVVQQLAYVALLVLGVWAVLGTAIARRLAFPLGFLFLAVPMGAGLEDPMMDLTADWTVRLIRLTGIPVYQEGRFFELPSGSWSVVQACSGVRYIIASFTLGLIYAYITYRSLPRRLLFVVASLAVPVAANVLRAFGIVMIGHFSGMKYATGVDHLIYGWVFFGLVMMLLFWIGSFWQEDIAGAGNDRPSVAPGNTAPRRAGAFVATAVLALVCAALGPALAGATAGATPGGAAGAIPTPTAARGWETGSASFPSWQPRPRSADRILAATYTSDDAVVKLFLQQFIDQTHGAELVAYGDPWVSGEGGWRVVSRRAAGNALADGTAVSEVEITNAGGGERLLAWSWYRVDGSSTANDYVAKLLEARQQLRFAGRSGARIFLATPVGGVAVGDARERLRAFLAAHEAGVYRALRDGMNGAEHTAP